MVVVPEYGDLQLVSFLWSRLPSIERLSLLRLGQALLASATRGDSEFLVCGFKFICKTASSVAQVLLIFEPTSPSRLPKGRADGPPRGKLEEEATPFFRG